MLENIENLKKIKNILKNTPNDHRASLNKICSILYDILDNSNIEHKNYYRLISLSEIQDIYKNDRDKLSKLKPNGISFMYLGDNEKYYTITKNRLEIMINETIKEMRGGKR